VASGWHGGLEANTVEYDPARVTVPAMVEALRRAGTYIKTF